MKKKLGSYFFDHATPAVHAYCYGLRSIVKKTAKYFIWINYDKTKYEAST